MPEQQQSLTIQQAIDLAAQHHNAGDLTKAEGIYKQILQSDPDQPVALHLLGVIAHQVGKNDVAVDLITKALAIKPDYAEAHSNLGNALQELGSMDEAVDHYHKALAIKPDFAEAHSNLGNALQELGSMDEAVSHYHKAIGFKPSYVEAHSNLGLALHGLGRLDEAVTHYRKALAIKPGFAEAHNDLGRALRELGSMDEAVDHYHKALAIKPDFAEAHSNLGNALQELGRFEDAIRSYDLTELGYSRSKSLECLYALERYDKFYRRLDKLIRMDEDNIRTSAISAFASQQLSHADPHPFCKKPMDFVRVYESLDGADDVDGFLHHLVDELKSRTTVWEPRGITTNKGFQSPPNLFINPIGLLSGLDRIIKDKIEIYRSEFSSEDCDFIRLMPKNISLKGWFVRLLKGGHQSEHIHPGGWLSGVFYLQVPKLSNQEEGAIEFGLWGYNYPILNKNYPKNRFYPKNGDIILFPSSLFHRTIPFHSDEERMSIAFDLRPTQT